MSLCFLPPVWRTTYMFCYKANMFVVLWSLSYSMLVIVMVLFSLYVRNNLESYQYWAILFVLPFIYLVFDTSNSHLLLCSLVIILLIIRIAFERWILFKSFLASPNYSLLGEIIILMLLKLTTLAYFLGYTNCQTNTSCGYWGFGPTKI